jgi:hypothetical protein
MQCTAWLRLATGTRVGNRGSCLHCMPMKCACSVRRFAVVAARDALGFERNRMLGALARQNRPLTANDQMKCLRAREAEPTGCSCICSRLSWRVRHLRCLASRTMLSMRWASFARCSGLEESAKSCRASLDGSQVRHATRTDQSMHQQDGLEGIYQDLYRYRS